eukprot:g2043.t1
MQEGGKKDSRQDEGPRRISGWLMKQGGGTSQFGRKNWKKRWFHMDLLNNLLLYYTTPGGELKGGIRLAQAQIEETITHCDFNLTPKAGDNRTYHLRALDSEQFTEWLASLRKAAQSAVLPTARAQRAHRGPSTGEAHRAPPVAHAISPSRSSSSEPAQSTTAALDTSNTSSASVSGDNTLLTSKTRVASSSSFDDRAEVVTEPVVSSPTPDTTSTLDAQRHDQRQGQGHRTKAYSWNADGGGASRDEWRVVQRGDNIFGGLDRDRAGTDIHGVVERLAGADKQARASMLVDGTMHAIEEYNDMDNDMHTGMGFEEDSITQSRGKNGGHEPRSHSIPPDGTQVEVVAAQVDLEMEAVQSGRVSRSQSVSADDTQAEFVATQVKVNIETMHGSVSEIEYGAEPENNAAVTIQCAVRQRQALREMNVRALIAFADVQEHVSPVSLSDRPAHTEHSTDAVWEQLIDDTTGDVYYYNPATEQTAWDPPAALTTMDKQAQSDSDAQNGAVSEAEDEWEEYLDETSGDAYFFNPRTRETRWSQPSVVGLRKVTSSSAAAEDEQEQGKEEQKEGRGDWEKHIDETSGDAYYYNSTTGETKWEEEVEDDGDEDALSNTSMPSRPSQDEWEKHIDETSGDPYFFNPNTGETTWNRPETLESIMVLDGEKEPVGEIEDNRNTTRAFSFGGETRTEAATGLPVVEVVVSDTIGDGAQWTRVEHGHTLGKNSVHSASSAALGDSFMKLKRNSIQAQRNSASWSPAMQSSLSYPAQVPPVLQNTILESSVSSQTTMQLASNTRLTAAPVHTDAVPQADASFIGRAANCGFPFPLESTRIGQHINGVQTKHSTLNPDEVLAHANSTRPIAMDAVQGLLIDFLQQKLRYGTDAERTTYAAFVPHDAGKGADVVACDLSSFVTRLMTSRPLMFLGRRDQYMLKDGSRGFGGFELVGSERDAVLLKGKLALEHLLSFDEIAVASLIGLSGLTHFFNDGKPNNCGELGIPGSFERTGVYTSVSAPRFDHEGLLDWQHIVVSPSQNTTENGYGAQTDPNAVAALRLAIWARFYGEGDGASLSPKFYFPSYEEAQNEVERAARARTKTNRFVQLPSGDFINCDVYRKRIRAVVEPFLLDANARGQDSDRSVYIHAIPIGLCCPGTDFVLEETVQTKLQLSVFADVLRERTLPRISDLDFSCFPLGDADGCRQCGGVRDGGLLRSQANSVTIHFSKRNAAAALNRNGNRRRTGTHASTRGTIEARTLLVAMYPADANAYPGNRFWDWNGEPMARPDAALDAVCSCTVSEMHCPEINPRVSGPCTVWYDEGEASRPTRDSVTLDPMMSNSSAEHTTQFARAKKSLLINHKLEGLEQLEEVRASLFTKRK